MTDALMVPQSIQDHLPSMVKNEMSKLAPQKQEEFVEEYRRKAKSTGTAYVLWFFLGLHYAYLGRWGMQFLYWVTAGGALVWAFIDLFRIGNLVRSYNKDVAMDVLRNLKAISG